METYEKHEFIKGQLDVKQDPYFYDRRLFREQSEPAPPPVVREVKPTKKRDLKNRKIL